MFPYLEQPFILFSLFKFFLIKHVYKNVENDFDENHDLKNSSLKPGEVTLAPPLAQELFSS